MNRSKRIDYKRFNETGEKIEISDNQREEGTTEVEEISNLMRRVSINSEVRPSDQSFGIEKQKIDTLTIEIQALGDDIDDYIDENEVEDLNTIEDIESCINKVEQSKSSYRRLHKEMMLLMLAEYDVVH